MSLSTAIIFALGVFHVAEAQERSMPYPCRVFGCGMETGDYCDVATNACVCQSTATFPEYQDFRCKRSSTSITDCSTLCTSPGTYITGGSPVCLNSADCLCKEAYFGQTCANKRFDVTCGADNTATINFLEPHPYFDNTEFNGNIYINTANTFDDAAVSALPDDCKSLGSGIASKVIKDTGSTAGECQLSSFTTSNQGEKLLFFYIQYNPSFRSDSDSIVRLRCFDGAQGVVSETSQQFTDNYVDPIDPLETTIATDPITGTTLQLRKVDASTGGLVDIDAHLRVGADIALVIHRADGSFFTLKECTAQNYDFNDEAGKEDLKSIKLLENWCVPPSSAVLFRGPLQYSDGSNGARVGGSGVAADSEVMTLPLNAFYFPGDSRSLFITCLICEDEADCGNVMPTCLNTLTSRTTQENSDVGFLGRRRRSTGDNSTVTTGYFSVSITVEDPENKIDVRVDTDAAGSQTHTTTSSDCYRHTSVLLPIILLAVLLLVTMVMTFFFCMKLTRNQEQQKMGHDNVCYKT